MRRGVRIAVAAAVGLSAGSGCRWLRSPDNPFREPSPPPAPVTYSRYLQPGFSWDGVSRVVVLPVFNGSEHTRAGQEVRQALASELQRLGRFEVTAVPPDDVPEWAERIHRGGRFDEPDLLTFARETRSDVVVFATVTQYSPYPRPRIGLVVQAVAPREAKVVASVDGLWDTADAGIAEQVRRYYRQTPRPRPPWVRNHVIASEDAFTAELALESPALFQRFVAQLVARTLTEPDGGEAPSSATPAGPCAPVPNRP